LNLSWQRTWSSILLWLGNLKRWVSYLKHHSRLWQQVKNTLLYKICSRFSRFIRISREFPLISPQNGHPSCRLGFDSSDVEARRASTRGWHTLSHDASY
jgi:hypothetical protein